MKRLLIPILAAALLLTGCSSVRTTKSFNGLALADGRQNVCHVSGKVSGLYCFSIPLITGNVRTPGSWMPAFLQPTVSLDSVADMVSMEARSRGAREILDVQSGSSNIWIMPAWILWWRTQTMTGNAVR